MTRNVGRKLPGPVSIPGAMIPTDSSSGSLWCEASGTNWIDGNANFPPYYAIANLSITAQSGGFSPVDGHTILVPHGMFSVEWVFTWGFRINGAPPFVGHGWTMWAGGSVGGRTLPPIAPYVQQISAVSELHIAGATTELGGGPSPPYNFLPRGRTPIGWRSIVRSTTGFDRLSVGIQSFHGQYPSALDESLVYFLDIQNPQTTGFGESWLKIVGVPE